MGISGHKWALRAGKTYREDLQGRPGSRQRGEAQRLEGALGPLWGPLWGLREGLPWALFGAFLLLDGSVLLEWCKVFREV